MPGNEWIYIGVFLLLAPIFPAAALLIPRIIAPRKPNPAKSQTYECGMETVGEARVQFHVQYYIFALIFLVFDVEMVFLFPGQRRLDQIPVCGAGSISVYWDTRHRAGLCLAKGALKWM
jgi:NADH:ubiquinone oxidoreductase subunit 3 (subunit A)